MPSAPLSRPPLPTPPVGGAGEPVGRAPARVSSRFGGTGVRVKCPTPSMPRNVAIASIVPGERTWLRVACALGKEKKVGSGHVTACDSRAGGFEPQEGLLPREVVSASRGRMGPGASLAVFDTSAWPRQSLVTSWADSVCRGLSAGSAAPSGGPWAGICTSIPLPLPQGWAAAPSLAEGFLWMPVEMTAAGPGPWGTCWRCPWLCPGFTQGCPADGPSLRSGSAWTGVGAAGPEAGAKSPFSGRAW